MADNYRRDAEARRIALRGGGKISVEESLHNDRVHSAQKGDISLNPSTASRVKKGYDSINSLLGNIKKRR